MKALPWILLALLIVAGVVAYLLLRNPRQRASVTVGEPSFTLSDAAADFGQELSDMFGPI